jgi:hypothetical protein
MRETMAFLLLFGSVAASDAGISRAAEWGGLRARFLYEGEPPVRKPIRVTVDHEYCRKQELLEEDLIVDRNTRGLANVVGWLYVGRGGPAPPIHKSYAKTETAEVKLDSVYCRIAPHVCLLRTSQTLLIGNPDPIGDGLKIDSLSNPPINITLAAGGELRRRFPRPERLPARVGCPIHPWESGWLLVSEHPYMAVSGADGRFEMKDLPAGNWTFQFWHERSRCVSEVKRNGQPAAWPRGRIEINIKPGENDLGDIQLAPALLEK